METMMITACTMVSNGRAALPWSEDVWNRIDRAVHDECRRTKVASKFLPIVRVSHSQLTKQADTVIVDNQRKLAVGEPGTPKLIELITEFCLTRQQVIGVL